MSGAQAWKCTWILFKKGGLEWVLEPRQAVGIIHFTNQGLKKKGNGEQRVDGTHPQAKLNSSST